jgi:hypothetical protein
MSTETLDEKLQPIPISAGRARCRLSQLNPRSSWHVTPDGRLPLVVGENIHIKTRMGEQETWRVVEAGKDPLMEKMP